MSKVNTGTLTLLFPSDGIAGNFFVPAVRVIEDTIRSFKSKRPCIFNYFIYDSFEKEKILLLNFDWIKIKDCESDFHQFINNIDDLDLAYSKKGNKRYIINDLLDGDLFDGFEMKVKKLKKTGECNFFKINIFFDCSSVFIYLAKGMILGHVFVFKDGKIDCYSDILKKIRNQNNSSISSLIYLSDEEIRDASVRVSGGRHFFFNDSYFRIRVRQNKSYEILMQEVISLHLFPPNGFISYSKKDDVESEVKIIRKKIREYFYFLDIKIDKLDENYSSSLSKYHNLLINGDIVYFIIGDGFLTSFYPMRELLDAMRARGIFIMYYDGELNHISETGIIPIFKDKTSYLYGDSSYLLKLKDKWYAIKNSTDKEINPDKEKSEEIYQNLDSIYKIMSDCYSHKKLDEHIKENCSTLAIHTRKAISNNINSKTISNEGRTFIDIYENYLDEDLIKIFN